jgi:LmbE family N-acetylglucosaminyl deacetylase
VSRSGDVDFGQKSGNIKNMNVLVIAPHPDDEVLGCGGTVKKYIEAGHDVYLCIMTKPLVPDWSQEYIDNKDKEIKASNDFMGFKETFFLDFPSLRMDTVPQKDLNDKLSEIINKVNPEILIIPFNGDINHDHKVAFDACLVALRPKPGLVIKKVLAYEISSTTDLGKFKAEKIEDVFIPNYYEDISKFLDDKVKAMELYESEIKEFPNPRSKKGIEVLAQKRGTECGAEAAEAFMLIREIK